MCSNTVKHTVNALCHAGNGTETRVPGQGERHLQNHRRSGRDQVDPDGGRRRTWGSRRTRNLPQEVERNGRRGVTKCAEEAVRNLASGGANTTQILKHTGDKKTFHPIKSEDSSRLCKTVFWTDVSDIVHLAIFFNPQHFKYRFCFLHPLIE